jgi:hypothetical protein
VTGWVKKSPKMMNNKLLVRINDEILPRKMVP